MSKAFEYFVTFEDGTSNSFALYVDPKTFVIKDDDSVEGPAWTMLDFEKCSHCPYNSSEKKYCPVAKNLAQASEIFKNERSYKKLTVFVKAEERTYGKKTDLQTALFSLFGLIMASSSCSHLHLFNPMARFHLPFASLEETKIRVLGTYLIGEYIKHAADPAHKIDLGALAEKYNLISQVNQGIINRIRSLKGGDASQNAIIVLDSFANLLPVEISSNLNEVKAYFE